MLYLDQFSNQDDFFLRILERDSRAYALIGKFQVESFPRYPLEVINEAKAELYRRKFHAAQCLKIICEAQTANRCGEKIIDELKQRIAELNSDKGMRYDRSINLSGLMDDALNFFVEYYGIPFKETLPMRKQCFLLGNINIKDTAQLSFEKKQGITQAFSSILSLWQAYAPLFSSYALADLTAHATGVVHENTFSLAATILMTRVLDGHKQSMPREDVWEVLSSLPCPDRGQRIFAYVYGTENHFECLFDEYQNILERIHALQHGASERAASFSSSKISQSIGNLHLSAAPPETPTPPTSAASLSVSPVPSGCDADLMEETEREIGGAASATARHTEPTQLSWAGVVKKNLSEQSKAALSLHTREACSSLPPAQFLLTRDGRRISLRSGVKASQSPVTRTSPPQRLRRAGSMMNVMPVSPQQSQPRSARWPKLMRTQSTLNLAQVQPATHKRAFHSLAENITSKLKGMFRNPFQPLAASSTLREEEEMQEESDHSETESNQALYVRSATAAAPSTSTKKKMKKKKSKKQAVQEGSKKDEGKDDNSARQMIAADNRKTVTQPVTRESIDCLVEKAEKLFQPPSSGLCDVAFVSILQQAEALLAQIDNVLKDACDKREKIRLLKTRSGLKALCEGYERTIRNLIGSKITANDSFFFWQKVPLLMKELYAVHKLQSFLPPGFTVESYCRMLLSRLDGLEKRYLVEYKLRLSGSEAETALMQAVYARSSIVSYLWTIDGMFFSAAMSPQIAMSTAFALESIVKDWTVPIPGFLNQFTDRQSPAGINNRYTTLLAVAKTCAYPKVIELLLETMNLNNQTIEVANHTSTTPLFDQKASHSHPAMCTAAAPQHIDREDVSKRATMRRG